MRKMSVDGQEEFQKVKCYQRKKLKEQEQE